VAFLDRLRAAEATTLLEVGAGGLFFLGGAAEDDRFLSFRSDQDLLGYAREPWTSTSTTAARTSASRR